MSKFQNIDSWEESQIRKTQKEDSLYNYYRDQLYVYSEIDPNSFSLKYENGESITEFSIKIPKAAFDDEEWSKKSIENEIRHRVGDNYATKDGHWQLSYADATDNGNNWIVDVMIRNGTVPIVNEQKEIDISNWERDIELKTQIEDNEIQRTISDLGIYADYIDENSLISKIEFEDNFMEFDLYIPKNLVSNFDESDVKKEIEYMLKSFDSAYRIAKADAKLITSEREAAYKNAKEYWKVHVYKKWGIR